MYQTGSWEKSLANVRINHSGFGIFFMLKERAIVK